jgi:NAD(P)-dependent dehydrogenase (short-subunit alcohol dehydrogenase family)
MRPFTEIPVEEWRQVMDVNVLSMFLTTRAVVPRMREQGGGRIVNISSGTRFSGVPFLLHYLTRKGAIVAL